VQVCVCVRVSESVCVLCVCVCVCVRVTIKQSRQTAHQLTSIHSLLVVQINFHSVVNNQ